MPAWRKIKYVILGYYFAAVIEKMSLNRKNVPSLAKRASRLGDGLLNECSDG